MKKAVIIIVLCLLSTVFVEAQTFQQLFNDASACQKKSDFYKAIKKYQAAALLATPDQKKTIDKQIDQCANELNLLVDKVKKEKARADELLAKSNELLKGLVPDTVKLLYNYFYTLAKQEIAFAHYENALRYLRFAKLSPDLPSDLEPQVRQQTSDFENIVKYNQNAMAFYRNFEYQKAEAQYRKILELLPGDTIINRRIEYCLNPVFKKENLVLIKGGTFTMGDGRYTDNTEHTVSLTDYYLSKYEVTNAEFAEFLNIYGSDKILDGEYAGEFIIDYGWLGMAKVGKIWQPTDDEKGESSNYPVMRVSWFGANEFCRFWNGSLPTEAQWEYAARSQGKDYKYSWGDDEPTGENTKQFGNIADEDYTKYWTGDYVAGYYDGYSNTAPVGSYDTNETGLYDMSGNVWEWCTDWYDKNYYTNAENETNPCNKNKGTSRVIRGGSGSGGASYCRVAYRYDSSPGFRVSSIGFRLALVP